MHTSIRIQKLAYKLRQISLQQGYKNRGKNNNIIQYAKTNNIISCKDCHYLKLSQFHKEYDSIYDNAVCRKFPIVYFGTNGSPEGDYELAKTCRKVSNLCGKDARYYETK